MRMLDDAKRTTELGRQRESLIERANTIRTAEHVSFSAREKGRQYGPEHFTHLNVKVLGDDFRALVTRELKAQVAEIDAQLRVLGVEPAWKHR